ncbi:hypothetical protein PHMEG_00026332, partial [Phytophthora megakarya]
MRVILFELGIEKSQVLARSSELQRKAVNKNIDPERNGGDTLSRENTLINHQNWVISELVAMNQTLAKPVTELEKQLAHPGQRRKYFKQHCGASNPKVCGSNSHSKWPAAIWFEWYAKTRRLWDVCENRQKKSTYKKIVNYMKLFLPSGFKLDPSSPTYCDHVLEVRQQSEEYMFKFFVAHGAKRKSESSVLKQLRKYYHEGKLNALITEFRARAAVELILDPAPCETQDLFNNESKRPQACQHQARATAVKAFGRFLTAESTNMEHVRALIAVDSDRAGCILVTLMDKFGVYLAFHAGARGQPLSRHSAAQYFRQVKCWLLDEYPVQAASTKESLKKMMSYRYSTDSCGSDYQDAALLCLLWYHFGRAFDLTFVRKQQLSIGAGEVFFIRFIREKTTDQQALSLFPDGDPTTCPLLALESPCAALLNHLPVESKDVPGELTKSIPLLDLLEDSSTLGSSQALSTNCSTSAKPVAGIHALVNRLLDRVAGPAGVEDALTSHSLRRGGAQYTNASSELMTQWIFDPGCLHGKRLLGIFDSVTLEQIREVSCKLFNASHGLANKTFNLSSAVIDVLTATIIQHYPSLMKFNAEAPAMKTIQRCTEVSGVTTTCLLAWSQQLARSTAHTKATADDIMGGNAKAKVVFDYQSALIERLIEVNRNLEARVNLLESTNTWVAGKTSAREDQEKRPTYKDGN